ncbi:hypothetical protein HIM_09773 [Hirsutella minnesotensis 3608]|nr:hypothetical protein HIM_09773 [Hirsutella minnesotensis 3608]
MGMTITSGPDSTEFRQGLIYTQYYNLVKAAFDAAKIFPFQSRGLEALALDPSYLADVKQATRGVHANINTLVKGYRLSKLRVDANIPTDATEESCTRPFVYGVRAEDRVSLRLLERIMECIPPPATAPSHPLPFFQVASHDTAGFLRASINRHCFLFEIVRSSTHLKFSLPETAVMAIALRGLRFSYGSGLLSMESALWADTRQSRTQGADGEVAFEGVGMGMGVTTKDHGFGWWLGGRMDWHVWRFEDDVCDKVLIGNSLLRTDHKRQWRAIRDIRDVNFRMWQAQTWFGKFEVAAHAPIRRIWLDYLLCTVIDLFQRDVWREARKTYNWERDGNDARAQRAAKPEMTKEAGDTFPEDNPPVFCAEVMDGLFIDRARDLHRAMPHLCTGNNAAIRTPIALVDFLFLPDGHFASLFTDKHYKRKGWAASPFRVATRRAMETIGSLLGERMAIDWYNDLARMVLRTNWILPWPSVNSLINTTKQHAAENEYRRLMWVSIVYREPVAPSGLFYPREGNKPWPVRVLDDVHYVYSDALRVTTFPRATWGPRQQVERWVDGAGNQCTAWTSIDLLKGQGSIYDVNNMEFGKATAISSSGRPVGIVERGVPPQPMLVRRIRNKTGPQLEAVFSELVQEAGPRTAARSGSEGSRALGRHIPRRLALRMNARPMSDDERNRKMAFYRVCATRNASRPRPASRPSTEEQSVSPSEHSEYRPPKKQRQ